MNKEAINKRIAALESELAGLKAELNKPEKFEFKYKTEPLWAININNVEDLSKYCITPADTLVSHFRYRQTEANAKADFQLQKELMCIGALAEQIDPDYKSKVNWENDSSKWFITTCDNENNKYTLSSNISWKNLGVVYMPKDVAEKVCEILNNRGVEL